MQLCLIGRLAGGDQHFGQARPRCSKARVSLLRITTARRRQTSPKLSSACHASERGLILPHARGYLHKSSACCRAGGSPNGGRWTVVVTSAQHRRGPTACCAIVAPGHARSRCLTRSRMPQGVPGRADWMRRAGWLYAISVPLDERLPPPFQSLCCSASPLQRADATHSTDAPAPGYRDGVVAQRHTTASHTPGLACGSCLPGMLA
jgi:hypothetical protein